MRQAVDKIDGVAPFAVVAQVVDGRLMRSSFHPKIKQWRDKAQNCVTCITRADLMSDSEILAALQFVEAAAPREAVVFLDLKAADKIKPKELNRLKAVLAGAAQEVRAGKLLMCGLPNAGKSSLVLPLTKAMTLKHRKKGAYHFPKVSKQAGMTKAYKAHRMSDKPDVFLVDTPGLIPRRAKLELELTLAACGVLPSFKHLERKQIAQYCLDAMNRHEEISGLPPQYPARCRLEGPTKNIDELIKAYGKSYAEFFENFKKGDFGPGRFEDPLPLDPNASKMRIDRKSIIVGMNERALSLLRIKEGGPP